MATQDTGNEHDNWIERDNWIALLTILAMPKYSSILYSKDRKASEKRAQIMVEAYESGDMSQTKIARAFDVSQAWVSQAIRGRQKRQRVRQR